MENFRKLIFGVNINKREMQKGDNKFLCCCPGSNWGPLVCKTNVITTTPQQLFPHIIKQVLYLLKIE